MARRVCPYTLTRQKIKCLEIFCKSDFATVSSLFISFSAFAQQNDQKKHFVENKEKMIENLGQEQSFVDQEIFCIKSAQKKEDLIKCHKQRRSSVKKYINKELIGKKNLVNKEK